MKPVFVHQVMSSFILWLDNRLCNDGQAYFNYSGSFYQMGSSFANYYVMASPFNQLIADSSVSGATIMTGIYLNNNFITTGVSGLVGINYKAGHTYFNNNIYNYPVSGYFSTKQFNVVLTDKQDDVLLFKSQFLKKPIFPSKITGVLDDHVVYPVVMVRMEGGEFKPYSFGGQETETISLRCIIFADTLFNLQGIQGLLRDSIRTPIALFSDKDMPYDSLGGLKSGVYNYTGMAIPRVNSQNFVFIDEVMTPRFSQRFMANANNLPYDVFFNFVDFNLTRVRSPRTNSW
jgi:hypothetical protein